MIKRDLEQHIHTLSTQFPIIALNGPRQSGKTTLVKALFPNKTYISLENPSSLDQALTDPQLFLTQHKNGLIIDEAQKAPELFSYLQGIVDTNKINGEYILTGSQNFLLSEKITQSLAGRCATATLHPLSLNELQHSAYKPSLLNQILFNGCYPRIYDQQIPSHIWYQQYITTYLEKDVRQILNIKNLSTFQRFLKICAARSGQLLDMTDIANACDISRHTVNEWLSVLESSFIAFRLYPHYKNFNKRLVKTPKFYFYDTGLVCNLLDLNHENQINDFYLRGPLFETYVVSEIAKYFYHQGQKPNIFFWQNQTKHEIDLLIEKGATLWPIEIKSGHTPRKEFLKNILYWKKLVNGSSITKEKPLIVYAGDENQSRTDADIISWKEIPKLKL